MERIAITGAAGLIGRLLVAELDRDYDVVGLDRARRAGVLRRREDTRRVDFTARAFAGARTVIDLAADGRLDATWREVVDGNIAATVGAL